MSEIILPKHLAIIMDGNGRWAKKRGMPRAFGHKQGVETVRAIVKHCGDIGIKVLTLYAFSTENWGRPQEEVSILLNLLLEYLKKDCITLDKAGVNIRVIGNIDSFPKQVRESIYEAVQTTKNNSKMILNIALSYGSRAELVSAVKKIASEVSSGNLSIDQIDTQLISDNLYTYDLPDPDLIIRTSGEQRLSNFLMYQAAYSELYFTPLFWPDFTPKQLDIALEDFSSRNRRFGGI